MFYNPKTTWALVVNIAREIYRLANAVGCYLEIVLQYIYGSDRSNFELFKLLYLLWPIWNIASWLALVFALGCRGDFKYE